MSIEIAQLGPGLYRPVVLCERCGKRILDATKAGIRFAIHAEGTPVPKSIEYLHTDCVVDPEPMDANRAKWLSLDQFPFDLANSMDVLGVNEAEQK